MVKNRSLLLLVALALTSLPGCLVLNVNPLYEEDTIAWEPALVGSWQDAEDKSSIDVQAGEWKSYTIRYVHPTETGRLTGYVTAVGGAQYLDVMPIRGEDRGAVLVPVHVFLQMRLDGDRLELTPVSYDWLADHLKASKRIPGLEVAFDQRHNVLIVSPTAKIRAWLRNASANRRIFGASAVFTRIRRASGNKGS